MTHILNLTERPADRVFVDVVDGELVVLDVNGARLLRLVPPSTSGVPVWQLESSLGVVYVNRYAKAKVTPR